MKRSRNSPARDDFTVARRSLSRYHARMNISNDDNGPDASNHHGNAGSFSAFLKTYGGLFDEKPGSADFVRIAWIQTPLGPMLAGADTQALRFLDFHDRRAIQAQIAALRRTSGLPIARGDCAILDELRVELGAYFERRLRSFSIPVTSPGTPFQALVWRALSEIPYGETRSYGEVARAIGSPNASRAVGTANGVNRIAIVVPCHRVVNADGSLGGYGGGLERKHALLELEGALPPGL